MTRAALSAAVAGLAGVLASCEPFAPCGWDEALDLGASFDVELVEAYTPASTTAFYSPMFDLTRPAPTCGALDGIAAGDMLTIRLVDAPSAISMDCSFWDAEITSPPLDLGTPNALIANNRSHNQIIASGRRDFGGGCEGAWEFSLHAPGDDPFMSQEPGATPVLLAYRVFATVPEANAACSALAGREPTTGNFVCGDAFVATMTPR